MKRIVMVVVIVSSTRKKKRKNRIYNLNIIIKFTSLNKKKKKKNWITRQTVKYWIKIVCCFILSFRIKKIFN